MKETVLQNFVINKMTQEQYDEALKSGTVKDDELYLTDVVASGGGAQIYDASEDIKGVAKIATSSEAKQGYNDNTIMTPLKTKQVIGDNIGRLNQLGYIGTLAGGVLTFEQPSNETPYELKVGYEYLVDLLFEAVGEISDDVQIVIKNGGNYINLVNVLHDDTVNPMTIGDIKQVMKYSIDLGWRWLFKAWYTETQAGAKVLVMPSTVVDTISEDTDNTFTGVNTFKGDNHPVVIEGMAGTTASGLQIKDSLGAGETDVEHYRSGDMYVSRLLNRNKIADKDSYIDLYTTDVGVSVLDESMVDSVLVPTPDSDDNTKRAVNTEWANNNLVHKSGDEEIGGFKTFTDEIIINNVLDAQETPNYGQLRLIQGKYGVILRNDGNGLYFLPTKENDQYGQWDSTKIGCSLQFGDGYFESKPSDKVNSVITTQGIQRGGYGYLKMGNGVLIQWGYVSGESGTVTLPTPFLNGSVYAISATNNAIGTEPRTFFVNNLTATNFGFNAKRQSGEGAANFNGNWHWIAMGSWY